MATVYITKELITRVELKIDGMRMSERKADVSDMDSNFAVDGSQLFNVGCWGADHVNLIEIIPKSWLEKVNEANISVYGKSESGVTLTAYARFVGLESAYWRPRKGSYNKDDSELTIDYLRALPEETVGRAELLRRWEETIIALSIDARWAKVSTDICSFLDKCKSLNEAVKLFPAVTLYIHRMDMDRLNRKLERPSKRKEIVESIDTEGLTAAAIAAKLMQAS